MRAAEGGSGLIGRWEGREERAGERWTDAPLRLHLFRPQDHLKVRLLTSQNALWPHLTRHRVGGAHNDICTVTCVHACATTSLEAPHGPLFSVAGLCDLAATAGKKKKRSFHTTAARFDRHPVSLFLPLFISPLYVFLLHTHSHRLAHIHTHKHAFGLSSSGEVS